MSCVWCSRRLIIPRCSDSGARSSWSARDGGACAEPWLDLPDASRVHAKPGRPPQRVLEAIRETKRRRSPSPSGASASQPLLVCSRRERPIMLLDRRADLLSSMSRPGGCPLPRRSAFEGDGLLGILRTLRTLSTGIPSDRDLFRCGRPPKALEKSCLDVR